MHKASEAILSLEPVTFRKPKVRTPSRRSNFAFG
ncbi:MAG: hypothetical protein H0W43_03005 [Chthoniobacterales bacterium]|nr:hypothetical protein [Chthoniobacterales bacterium]